MTTLSPQAIIAETRPEVPSTLDDIKTNTTKTEEEFRIYDEATSLPRVVEHYRDMRRYQTVDFYRRMEQKYDFTNGNYRKLMTIEEAFVELENYVVSTNSWNRCWPVGRALSSRANSCVTCIYHRGILGCLGPRLGLAQQTSLATNRGRNPTGRTSGLVHFGGSLA